MSRRKMGTSIVALAALVWLSLPFAAGQDGQPKAVYPATVHDFGTMDEAQPFMVMELLNGESLGDRMEREPPLTRQQ